MYELEIFYLTHFSYVSAGYWRAVFHNFHGIPRTARQAHSLAVRGAVIEILVFYDWIVTKTVFSTFPRYIRTAAV